MSAYLKEMKLTTDTKGAYELHKMTKEKYVLFRYHFVEERMYNPTWCANKNKQAMELLLSALVLILCKKVPSECDVKRIDKLHEKVKLIRAPAEAFTN